MSWERYAEGFAAGQAEAAAEIKRLNATIRMMGEAGYDGRLAAAMAQNQRLKDEIERLKGWKSSTGQKMDDGERVKELVYALLNGGVMPSEAREELRNLLDRWEKEDAKASDLEGK